LADTTAPKLIEYAGTSGGRDITRGFVGAIHKWLPSQDSLLEQKSGGDLELYELVAQDDQVKSCLQQRFRALVAKDWEVIPGGEKRIDKQAAEHLEKQLEAINWDNCNEKMLFGIHYGYSAAEILWERQDDKVGIAAIKVRNRRRFHFNADQDLVLKTMQNPLGEDLPERKFWHFCTGADHDDEPYGRGLGHWLYWPTFFKRNGVRWWLKFIEKYAKPTRLGKYPAGATQGEKDVLWNALDSFGDDDRSMIPEGLEMLFLESARSGTVDYKALCDQMDGAIAKIILSQTMTTDNGSSRSQAEVHEGVKDEVIESDSDLLCESFNNSVATWLTDWNFPGAAYPKVRRKIQVDPDPAAMADTDTKLQGLGISLKPEAIATKYGEDYIINESPIETPQLSEGQINSLITMVSTAKAGGWTSELLGGLINTALPNLPDEAVSAITENLGDDKSGNAPIDEQPIDLNAISTQFAAPKQKKCVKGISCGNSCISATKTCRKPLTEEQKKAKDAIIATAATKVKPVPEAKIPKVQPKAEEAKIDSLGSFETAVIDAFKKLEKENDGLVPIHKLRAALGQRVNRKDFDDHLLEMQANDVFQLQGGSLPGANRKELEDSVQTELSGLRTYAALLDGYEKNLTGEGVKSNPKAETESKSNPKAEKIDTQKAFEPAILAVYDKLNRDYKMDDLVPIHRLRTELGDRVNREDFDKWISKMNEDDKFDLGKGSGTKQEEADSITGEFGTKFYATKIN
jgi:phage gp29-like protein